MNQIRQEEETYISESEKALGSQSIGKLFAHYSIPGVIGLLFIGIQSIVDGLMVGNLLGADALAAVSLVLPLFSLIIALSVIIGIGSQTIVSINLGKKNYSEANDAMTTGFIAILTSSIFLAAFTLGSLDPLARLLGANELLLPLAKGYMMGLFPFVPLLGPIYYSDFMIKAIGHPRYAMSIISGAVILNILFNWVFIQIFGWGTMGTGLATGFAFCSGGIFSFLIVFNKKNIISVQSGRFRMRLLKEMFYNGSSEGLTELAAGISTFLFNITLMKYLGESGVAAFTVINYVFFVGTTVFLGISDGIIPIISYNYGANLIKRVKKVLFLGYRTNIVIGLILFSILFFFSQTIISFFFRENDGTIITIASQGAAIYAFAFLTSGFNILSSSFFTGMANAKISVIIASLRGLIFTIAGILLLPHFIGIEGIWLTIPIAESLTFLISFILVYRKLKSMATQQ